MAGLNGRGQSHLSGWLSQDNVEIAYLIDPDQKVLAAAMNGLQGRLKDDFKAKTSEGACHVLFSGTCLMLDERPASPAHRLSFRLPWNWGQPSCTVTAFHKHTAVVTVFQRTVNSRAVLG